MTDIDLEGLIRKDLVAPVPQTPEVAATLTAVRMRAAALKPSAVPVEKPTWALIGSAAALSLCSVAVLIERGASPLVLAIPALELMVSQTLANREVKRI